MLPSFDQAIFLSSSQEPIHLIVFDGGHTAKLHLTSVRPVSHTSLWEGVKEVC